MKPMVIQHIGSKASMSLAYSCLLLSIITFQCDSVHEPRAPGPDIRVRMHARAHVLRSEFVRANENAEWIRLHQDTLTINLDLLDPWVWLWDWPELEHGWYNFYHRWAFTDPVVTYSGNLSSDRGTLKNFTFRYTSIYYQNDAGDSVNTPDKWQELVINLTSSLHLSDTGGVRFWMITGSNIPKVVNMHTYSLNARDLSDTHLRLDSLLEMKYDTNSYFSVEFRWTH